MAKDKRGPLRSVVIRCLENGYIGSCSYESLPGKSGECCPYVPDKEYALPDDEAALAFVSKALEGAEYQPRGRDDDEKWENAGKDAKARNAAQTAE